MRQFRVLLSFGLISFWAATAAAAVDSDSLQVRLYHGLDEIGSSTDFFFKLRNNQFWSKWAGNASGLYRRPLASQGDLRTDARLHGEIGRLVRSNLDIKSVFESSDFQYQQFHGPQPWMFRTVMPPPTSQLLQNPASSSAPVQQIKRSFLGLGATYHPMSVIAITGLAGGRWDRREGFDDQGYNATLSAGVDSLLVGGYKNELDLFAEQEELGNRLNSELKLDFGVEKQFTPTSSDHLAIHYRRKRYDYHVWGISSIGTRLDGDRSFNNQFRYNVNPAMRILWDTQISDLQHEDRTSNGHTIRQETNSATALTLNAIHSPWVGRIRGQLEWGDQKDVTGLKRQKGITLENGITWRITSRDSLDFTTAVRKKQYDTSDTANYDDRDRLRYEFEVFYRRTFDPYFWTCVRSEVILEHIAYIFAEKSDQNNWNRIFKLIPEVYFQPAWNLSNLARFELVANTTDYDFELDAANLRSTIYRRYTAEDSLTWIMQPGWNLVGESSLSLEDGGRLLWDQWIQQIADEYRSYSGSLTLQRETQSGIRLDMGLSLYERRGWEYTTNSSGDKQKTPVSYLTRWGPLLRCTYPSASHLIIEAIGDLSWIHEWGIQDYTIVNLDLRVTWR